MCVGAGFVFIPNPFTSAAAQEVWARRALRRYLAPHNRTNLSATGHVAKDMWRRHVQTTGGTAGLQCVECGAPLPARARGSPDGGSGTGEGPTRGSRGAGAGSVDSGAGQAKGLYDITWVTLGFHYDWTHRAYHTGASWVSPFPPRLGRVSAALAAVAGAVMHDPCVMYTRMPP